MVLIAIAVFAVVGGYVLGAFILALLGRTMHLKIVAPFLAFLALEYGYSEGKNWIRGADYRYTFDNATVYVTEAGPLTFAREEYNGPVTTLRDGPTSHRIGFRIEGVAVAALDVSRRYAVCPTAPRANWLDEIYEGRGRASCPSTGPGGNRYFRSAGDSVPPVMLQCLLNKIRTHGTDGTEYCVMTFGYDHFNVKVSMGQTPRSLWRQARDQVIGILDQSFKVEFKDLPKR